MEAINRWKEIAEKSGLSLSKFVIERVEDSIMREEAELRGDSGRGYLSRVELMRRLKKTEEELKALGNENRLFKKLDDNLERGLRRYRSENFTNEEYLGVRGLDKELVDLLRKGHVYRDEETLSRLNVDPSDACVVRAVTKQLETLERYGLVEFTVKGWRWRK
ncbi:MAG: hypothetical protein QXM93_03315 [Candidatus Methanomethyliaceae archaeon]